MSRAEWLRQFYERRRQVKKYRARGLSYSKVGAKLGVSRQRAWQLDKQPTKGYEEAQS